MSGKDQALLWVLLGLIVAGAPVAYSIWQDWQGRYGAPRWVQTQ